MEIRPSEFCSKSKNCRSMVLNVFLLPYILKHTLKCLNFEEKNCNSKVKYTKYFFL